MEPRATSVLVFFISRITMGIHVAQQNYLHDLEHKLKAARMASTTPNWLHILCFKERKKDIDNSKQRFQDFLQRSTSNITVFQ